jgi:TolB-like protein
VALAASVALLAVGVGLAPRRPWVGPVAQAAEPVIAVLAFDNLSGSPDQDIVSDGISEDIITARASATTAACR